jgi:hypothetical protein
MNQTSQQISTAIALNRQAGQRFTVKMKDDPSVLLGIPVPATMDPDKFIINLSNPEPGRTGTLFEGRIADIQFMEKV